MTAANGFPLEQQANPGGLRGEQTYFIGALVVCMVDSEVTFDMWSLFKNSANDCHATLNIYTTLWSALDLHVLILKL
jgi:hypothetical protein